jgi:hypothetical protein
MFASFDCTWSTAAVVVRENRRIVGAGRAGESNAAPTDAEGVALSWKLAVPMVVTGEFAADVIRPAQRRGSGAGLCLLAGGVCPAG